MRADRRLGDDELGLRAACWRALKAGVDHVKRGEDYQLWRNRFNHKAQSDKTFASRSTLVFTLTEGRAYHLLQRCMKPACLPAYLCYKTKGGGLIDRGFSGNPNHFSNHPALLLHLWLLIAEDGTI